MNGERAPGVNRQTAGNLARQRRPQSGAVCKVQCDSNPTHRKFALPNPAEVRWRGIVLYRTLHRFPLFAESGGIPVVHPLIFGTFYQEKVRKKLSGKHKGSVSGMLRSFEER